jgi:hypothetical protein
VEERLRFYDDGVAPRKNATVMAEAVTLFNDAAGDDDDMDAADVLAGVPPGLLPDGEGAAADGAKQKKKNKKKKSKERESVRDIAVSSFDPFEFLELQFDDLPRTLD